jgi:hypothetical protein
VEELIAFLNIEEISEVLKMCKQWGWQVGREEKSKTNISHP